MNYPNGIKKKKAPSIISYKNRGMTLESDLNESNTYYKENKIAYIYKKPTPIKLVKVDYKKNLIKEAYFDKPSTTDYNGIYKGKYIDFEAKETTSKTSFPLKNIHPHQIEHIRNINEEKGISFLIVRFTTLDKTYLLRGEDFLYFIDNENRKSIPLTYFNDKAYYLKSTLRPRVDYIKIINQIMEVNKWRKIVKRKIQKVI